MAAFQDSYKASASFDTQLKPVSSSCMKSIASLNAAGLPRENALVQALPLSSWRPELPAVQHHSHTFRTRSYTRRGRANTFAQISEPPPQPAPWTAQHAIQPADVEESSPACHSHPALRSVLSRGNDHRRQRRPRSRIANRPAPIAQQPPPHRRRYPRRRRGNHRVGQHRRAVYDV